MGTKQFGEMMKLGLFVLILAIFATQFYINMF